MKNFTIWIAHDRQTSQIYDLEVLIFSPVIYDSLFGSNRVRNSTPNPTNRHLSPLNRNFSPTKGQVQDLGDVGKENFSNITLDQVY